MIEKKAEKHTLERKSTSFHSSQLTKKELELVEKSREQLLSIGPLLSIKEKYNLSVDELIGLA